jgi:hypothetical protein
MIAGPSEVVILATAESNPRFIAADILPRRIRRAACAICSRFFPHAPLVRRR